MVARSLIDDSSGAGADSPADSVNSRLLAGRPVLSPARVMGPPLCHEHGTGLCPVAGRVVIVTDDGAVGQFGWSELAGLARVGFWRCR